MEESLIISFNLNIERIRNANAYFRKKKGNKKSIEELDSIIVECNNICKKLISLGYNISCLDMTIV